MPYEMGFWFSQLRTDVVVSQFAVMGYWYNPKRPIYPDDIFEKAAYSGTDGLERE